MPPEPALDAEPSLTTARRRRGLAVAVLLGAVVFLPALGGELVLDDVPAIAESTCVTGPLDLGRIFARNFWCQDPAAASIDAWRPLPVLLWWIAWQLGSGAAGPLHAIGWLAHLGCVALVWRLAGRLGLEPRAASVAAVCFAIMPIHADAVASVVGAADVVSTLGVLVTLLACLERGRGALPLALLGSVVAILSKESGAIVLPLSLLAWWMSSRDRERARAATHPALLVAGVGLVVVAALSWRAQVLGGWTAQHVTFGVNPLIAEPAWLRVPASFGLWTRYIQTTLLGSPLSADYSFDAIPLSGVEFWARAGSGLLGVAGLCWLALRELRRGRVSTALLIAWHLGAAVLACQLVTLLPAIFAERLFYGATVPLAVLAGRVVSPLLERRLANVGLIAYLLVQAVLCAAHAWAWRREADITAITVASTPRSARAQVWHARVLLRAEQWEQAYEHADAAARIHPSWGVPDALAGAALDAQDMPQEAAERFQRATSVAPGEFEVADLAIQFLLRYGHRPQARAIYDAHQRARGGHADPRVTRP